VLKDIGRLDEAIVAIRRAIALRPSYAEAYSNLGNVLRINGQMDGAVAGFRQAITLDPNIAEAHNNLGNALKEQGQTDEAIASYRRAIALNPKYAEAHNNLGNALKDIGQLDEAIAAFREAVALNPRSRAVHSNLVYTFYFHRGYDLRAIAEELQRWNRQHAEPLGKFILPHTNDRSPDRRLRIGYVSPDLDTGRDRRRTS